ncbi:hypothetical protein FDUTEX481_03235 [Tolypothrix sp. PCC 7601]|nr:hypothetical protein FDUTEX481_03235 [Tolypothrix sp. PCC 7601]
METSNNKPQVLKIIWMNCNSKVELTKLFVLEIQKAYSTIVKHTENKTCTWQVSRELKCLKSK